MLHVRRRSVRLLHSRKVLWTRPGLLRRDLRKSCGRAVKPSGNSSRDGPARRPVNCSSVRRNWCRRNSRLPRRWIINARVPQGCPRVGCRRSLSLSASVSRPCKKRCSVRPRRPKFQSRFFQRPFRTCTDLACRIRRSSNSKWSRKRWHHAGRMSRGAPRSQQPRMFRTSLSLWRRRPRRFSETTPKLYDRPAQRWTRSLGSFPKRPGLR